MKGEYIGASRNLEGDLIVSFAIDEIDIQKLEDLKGKELSIEVEKYRKKRSLNANAYFWQLCDKIAKKLGSDKDTIYLMLLKEAGVFEIIDVIEEAVPRIEALFRTIDIDYQYTVFGLNADGEEVPRNMVSLKCYRGSHEYNSKQMAELINNTVQQAQELGIDTMTADEIEHICSLWEAR